MRVRKVNGYPKFPPSHCATSSAISADAWCHLTLCFPRGCGRLAIPTEDPANEETDVHERVHERRGCERERACRPQKLVQRDAGARPLQIDGPHVMNRHAGKKVVNPQWQPFDSCVEICGIEHPSPCRPVDFEFVPSHEQTGSYRFVRRIGTDKRATG